MGLKVEKREPEVEIEQPKFVFIGAPMDFMGFPTFNGTAEQDADILEKAEEIMQNKARYKAAKRVLKKRGY